MKRGKQGPEDWLEAGFRVVQESIGERPKTVPTPADTPGRAGGLVGGKARAAKLSAEERRAIGQKAAAARWGDTSTAILASDSAHKPVRHRGGNVKIEWAHLAQGLKPYPNGYLDILGVFSGIVENVPCKLPHTPIVAMRLSFEMEATGKDFSLNFRLLNPKGKLVQTLKDPIIITPQSDDPYDNVRLPIGVPVDWVEFHEHGYHTLVVTINDEPMTQVEINVGKPSG